MLREGFRFAVVLAAGMALAAVLVGWVFDLPLRDPDSVAGPTYLRLPAILLAAFLADVLPRAVWRARRSLQLGTQVASVVKERWGWAHVRFALAGLLAWYVTYASFRNLKSFVPFVNDRLWDGWMADVDRLLWFGHDPAAVLHSWLGTDTAAHFLSFVYVAWIAFVPISLGVALVWSRDSRAAAWYVTAVAVAWALGVATYFLLPTLGPVYSEPHLFTGLSHTYVTDLQTTMMGERREVLTNPFTTKAVQTIAAFASLHVGVSWVMCLMAELLRLPRALRAFLWVFLALTVLSTIYLGWHFSVDALGGVALGTAAVWVAAKGTGNAFRRRRPEAAEAEAAAAHA
jgi:hypothetical protein